MFPHSGHDSLLGITGEWTKPVSGVSALISHHSPSANSSANELKGPDAQLCVSVCTLVCHSLLHANSNTGE